MNFICLPGFPVVMELVTWLQENLYRFAEAKGEDEEGRSGGRNREEESKCQLLLVIEIDHMRNFKGYSSLLRCWASELDLSGRLLAKGDSQKNLLLVLLGDSARLREFEKRLRTEKVDVDSRGKPCKEKMQRVLGRWPSEEVDFGGRFDVARVCSPGDFLSAVPGIPDGVKALVSKQ